MDYEDIKGRLSSRFKVDPEKVMHLESSTKSGERAELGKQEEKWLLGWDIVLPHLVPEECQCKLVEQSDEDL